VVWHSLDGRSRISREAYVRTCGSRRVKFPPATRLEMVTESAESRPKNTR